MTMTMDIKEQYLDQFEHFIKSLPKDAVIIKKSLDEEIQKRISEYQQDSSNTIPFDKDLSNLRAKLKSQI